MRKILCAIIAIIGILYAGPRPMESLNHYNVVLVHGAAPEEKGFESECNSDNIYDANTMMSGHFASPQTIASQLGGAAGMLGDYENEGEKKLTYWLDSAVFEDYRYRNGKIYMDSTNYRKSPYIYIQRSFTNPAESPAHNAHEIGDRTWKGDNKCSVRRSLFEEAQEVRAGGQDSLRNKRESQGSLYRTIPSRNILIAHSMGGLASREYVQGDGYNGDVDKVITLDSPHKGTHSLDGFLDMSHYIAYPFAESILQETFLYGTSVLIMQRDPLVDNMAVISLSIGMLAANTMNGVVQGITGAALGYGFKDDDPLVDYIRPGSDALNTLNQKKWNDSLPMFRVLYGVGGLTFGSNKEYGQIYASVVVPDALYAMVKNITAQISHTEIENPAYWNNIVASGTLGLFGGLSLTDQGSILIPHWSGAGEGASIFEDPNANVQQEPFDANEIVNEGAVQGIAILATTIATLVAANILDAVYPGLSKPTRLAIGISAAAILTTYVLPPTIAAVMDMTENHKNPSQDYWQEKQKSKKNSYTKISGGSESVESYLLEDFLYEKPFVNLSVHNDNDWTESVDSTKMDSLGLYGKNGSLAVKSMKTTRGNPLKFTGLADWGMLGVKVDRWERVDGLKPDGSDNPGGVPIRHVERYEVPAITVDNWIEKYSFVVDDLMPHRLRQIRMNFNYQEEIAWECDVTKDYEANDNCTVYKRTSGSEWTELRKEKHPVKKNGQFDFEPRKYGYDNLLAIQKDNQNTVTISTVNKIGLSNTQRFYATA